MAKILNPLHRGLYRGRIDGSVYTGRTGINQVRDMVVTGYHNPFAPDPATKADCGILRLSYVDTVQYPQRIAISAAEPYGDVIIVMAAALNSESAVVPVQMMRLSDILNAESQIYTPWPEASGWNFYALYQSSLYTGGRSMYAYARIFAP